MVDVHSNICIVVYDVLSICALFLPVPPIVSLMLGSTLNPDDIKEGDDVYFECHVKANPAWRKLTWLHNVSHSLHVFNIKSMSTNIFTYFMS